MKNWIKRTIIGILSIILVGFLIPQNLQMPVVGAGTILFLVLFPLFPLWIIYVFYINTELTNMGVKAYLEHYAAKQNICYDKDMLNEVCRYNFNEDSSIQELSNICIAAYRKKNGLPNYYK